MFGKKKTPTPTTVAEAIAPFKQVKDNLVAVMGQNSARKAEATKRIDDARAYAAQVEKDETAAAKAAQAEMDQAAKIAEALGTLLGEEAVVSTVSKSAAERAAKINEARTE